MTQANPAFGEPVPQRGDVAAALGLREADLVADLPVQQVSCGVPFLFVPLADRETVDRAISDAAAFRRMRSSLGVNGQLFLFSIDPPSTGVTAYSRMFAPEFGIVEDPATGSASGPLGCYLVEHGVVAGAKTREMVSLQGVAMGRASRVHIAVSGRPGAIAEVKVGGSAVLVGRGELLV
jgi:trans-2,3-dihydro-3-hydroxyanthranilate isomerase